VDDTSHRDVPAARFGNERPALDLEDFRAATLPWTSIDFSSHGCAKLLIRSLPLWAKQDAVTILVNSMARNGEIDVAHGSS
jgi:hypothetical protein